jgi:hypothetical protein
MDLIVFTSTWRVHRGDELKLDRQKDISSQDHVVDPRPREVQFITDRRAGICLL